MSLENIGRFKGTAIAFAAGHQLSGGDSRFNIQRAAMLPDQHRDERASARMAIPAILAALWLLIGLASTAVYVMV